MMQPDYHQNLLDLGLLCGKDVDAFKLDYDSEDAKKANDTDAVEVVTDAVVSDLLANLTSSPTSPMRNLTGFKEVVKFKETELRSHPVYYR